MLAVRISNFSSTELEEQEYKYIILGLELHGSIHMAGAGLTRWTHKKKTSLLKLNPGNMRVMVRGKLKKQKSLK